MNTDPVKCYPMAAQAVRDSIAKDNYGQTKEAYCSYLSSILLMVQALKDEACKKEMANLSQDASLKIYKLVELALGRAKDILNSQNAYGNTKTDHGAIANVKKQLSNLLLGPSLQSLTGPIIRRDLKSTPSAGTTSKAPVVKSQSTPPSMFSHSMPSTNPAEAYRIQNLKMFQAYQQRKSKNVMQKYTSCNQNMSMLREMSENKKMFDIKMKEYQEKMMKRNQEIKSEAERRWNRMNARSSKDKEYRQSLLEKILAYEADAKWPITLREKMTANSEDGSMISHVITTILTYNEHPLCKMLKEIQFEVYSSIEPLIKDFKQPGEFSTDYYLVPVEDVSRTLPRILTNNTPVQPTQSENVNNNFSTTKPLPTTPKIDMDSFLEKKFVDLEDDMFSSSDSDDEDTTKASLPYDFLQKTNVPVKTDSNKSTYDQLWDIPADPNDQIALPDDSGENYYQNPSEYYSTPPPISSIRQKTPPIPDEEDGAYQDPSNFHSSLPGDAIRPKSFATVPDEDDNVYQDPTNLLSTTIPSSHYESLTAPYDENLYEDINNYRANEVENEYEYDSNIGLSKENNDLIRKADLVVQDILFGIDRIHSVLLLTYENMNSPAGRDLSYAHLESIFFRPLWPWIICLFRKLHAEKEDAMTEVLSTYKDCDMKMFGVQDKLILFDQNSDKEPYSEAIKELSQILQFTSPLDKLECTVRVSKAVCDCVEIFYSNLNQKAPSVGCDDLLPIVAYVVLKSQLPHIISECYAMTEFICDGYMMGEEGYCLTTLHAAISTVLSHAKSRN